MKTLLPYKLKVSTQTVTKDFVTLCPEYEVLEKIKKGLIKETIKVNNDKRNGYIKSSRSQSSQKPLTTSRLNGNGRTIGKIEMLFQPTLGKLDDLRYLIRKDIRRENKNTEREVRHQRILNEMRDIENCIDYKEDKKWYPLCKYIYINRLIMIFQTNFIITTVH